MAQTLGTQLKGWLDREGRKAQWLAAQVPVTPSHLSRWLNDKVVPSNMAIRRLEGITGLQLQEPPP